MLRLILRRIFIKKRPLDERPEKSFVEIFKEMMELDNKPRIGFAFIHPILAHNYDLRAGRKVITDMGIGSVHSYISTESYLNIYLDKQKYIIRRHVNNVFIIVVMCDDKQIRQLTFHDWNHISDKLVDRPMSFKIEYRYTTHGNCCLTDKFKEECRQSK